MGEGLGEFGRPLRLLGRLRIVESVRRLEVGNGRLVESVEDSGNCLESVAVHCVAADGLDEPPSRDDLGAGADDEVLAGVIRPTDEGGDEGGVIGEAVGGSDTVQHLDLDSLGRVLVGDALVEAVEEGCVEDIGPHELARLVALSLGVRRCEHGEPLCGRDPSVCFLHEDRLTFQRPLDSKDAVGRTVGFVKVQHRTPLHRHEDRSIDPHGVAVDESVATDQIVLRSLRGELHESKFSPVAGASLFD